MSPEPKRTPQPPAYEPVEDADEPTAAPLADEHDPEGVSPEELAAEGHEDE